MKYCLITFRSVTPAQSAELLLQRNGVNCSLQRTPRSMAQRGCGYCLRVRYTDAPRCVQLFREKGVAFQKVYLQLSAGTAEELEL